jgi:putative transposase
VIREMNDKYPSIRLGRLCRLLGVTRQALYQYEWRYEELNVEAELIIQEVLTIRRHHPAIGTRKLYFLLQSFLLEHQIKIGRDGLFDLLSSYKLLVRRRKRNICTTQSRHRFYKYRNIIKEYVPTCSNQVWVSDITYHKIANDKWVYISFITDAYSRKIVGYQVAESLRAVYSVNALKMALSGLNKLVKANLIHHSDRGVQYCCDEYVQLLNDNNIKISMTENGDPLENAIAERVNGIIKEEYLVHYKFKNKKEVEKRLHQTVNLYNDHRPHMSCGLLTPNEAHKNNLPIERKWKNYYKKNQLQ